MSGCKHVSSAERRQLNNVSKPQGLLEKYHRLGKRYSISAHELPASLTIITVS